MYELEINTINTDANGKYFNKWLRDNYTFKGIGYTDNQILISFDAEPLQTIKNEITAKYAALTVNDIIAIAAIIPVFDQKKSDGIEYFFYAKANYFGLRYHAGELDDANVNYIYNKLSPLSNMLNNGDWVPAKYHMTNKLLENQLVSADDISNGYTQDIHNAMLQDLTDYINN